MLQHILLAASGSAGWHHPQLSAPQAFRLPHSVHVTADQMPLGFLLSSHYIAIADRAIGFENASRYPSWLIENVKERRLVLTSPLFQTQSYFAERYRNRTGLRHRRETGGEN